MKRIFIAYNHKDKVIARLIYHFLVDQDCPDISVFMDEFSITPGKDLKDRSIAEAKKANIGIVILSEYTSKSEYVPQEVGIMRSQEVPIIFVALHEDWKVPPGYEKTNKSYPLYDAKDPLISLGELVNLIENTLGISPSDPRMLKQKFVKQHLGALDGIVLPQRDAYVIVHALKCAESEIKIMGENALHPIHGGFEHLLRLLKSGRTVQVLLLNYNSQVYQGREVTEAASQSGRIRADWISALANLVEINRMRKGIGKFLVRCHTTDPKGSLIIVDDWLVQFNPYEPAGVGGRRGFGHEMHLWLNRGQEKSRFKDYTEMFETLWQSAHEIDLSSVTIRDKLPKEIKLW